MVFEISFNEVKIVNESGTIGSENKATGTLTSTPTSYYFGGSSDLWSDTWSAADINNSNFGVVVAFQVGAPVGAISHYLKATNFGFNIPTGATIDGIYVEINAADYTSPGPKGGAIVYYIKITVTYTYAYPHFVAAGAIAFDTSGPLSVTPTPPTYQADDILMIASFNRNADTMTTATSGWTKIGETSTAYCAWFWKRATASGTAGATITCSGAQDTYAICYVIRGCVTSGTPYEDATIGAATSDDNPDTLAIDTTDVNRFAVSIMNGSNNLAWDTSPPPAGWDEDDETQTTLGTDAMFLFISKGVATASSVSATRIGVISFSTGYGVITLAFIPAEAAAGTNMTVNVDDSHKAVATAYVNVDDAWKVVANAYVNKDDAWKTIF